jgi:hypothetical protein
VQNRAARIITGKSYEIRTSELLKELNWQTLEERRENGRFTLIHVYTRFQNYATSLKNTLTSKVSFMSQKLLKIANVNKLSKDILNRI